MAIGMLGTVLAGAAGGAGEAMQQNVAEQNKQIIAQNLEQQRMEVESHYQAATEQRHVAQAATFRSQVIGPIMQQDVPALLSSQGFVPPGTITPEQQAAGKKEATLEDIGKAQAIALANKGVTSPEEVSKGGYGIMNSEEHSRGMLDAWSSRSGATVQAAEINAAAKEGAAKTGAAAKVSAADIAAGAKKYQTDMLGKIANLRNGTLSQVDAQKLLTDPTFPMLSPDIQSGIKAKANPAGGVPQIGTPTGAGGALGAGNTTPAPVSWNSLQP